MTRRRKSREKIEKEEEEKEEKTFPCQGKSKKKMYFSLNESSE